MKKKYEILNFNLKELDLLEKHLNRMAKDHWHLKWISNYIICYEYNEDEVHYYIDYNQFSFYDKKKEDNRIEAENQISFYHDLGYEFVCSFDHYVIYKSETLLEFIHTNEEIKDELFNHVKNRTNKYNLFILFGYFIFLFIYFYLKPKEALHSFFDYTYTIIGSSLLIAIYFTIQNYFSKRNINIKEIKRRTIVHFIIKLIQCILLYLFVILSASKIESLGILVGYYCVYNVSNLIYFQSSERKYKHIPFIANTLPYILVAFFLIIGIFKNDTLYIYESFNENYPQNIIHTEFFMNSPKVIHYNENESITLHMIECRIEEDDEVINFYYYHDKTNLLRPLILNYYGYSDTKEIIYVDNVEIHYIKRNSYGMSYLTLIKDKQYVTLSISEEYTNDLIQNLIHSIQWK